MKTAGWFLTLGLGMAAGAVVSSMLPRDCEVKRAVENAADTVQQTARKAVDSLG